MNGLSQTKGMRNDRRFLFFFQMQMANPRPVEHLPPPQSWAPPPNVSGGPGFGPTHQYMPPPVQLDNYYPPAELPPPVEKQPHHGISVYGRDAPAPPLGVHATSNTQSAPSMVTQVVNQGGYS